MVLGRAELARDLVDLFKAKAADFADDDIRILL